MIDINTFHHYSTGEGFDVPQEMLVDFVRSEADRTGLYTEHMRRLQEHEEAVRAGQAKGNVSPIKLSQKTAYNRKFRISFLDEVKVPTQLERVRAGFSVLFTDERQLEMYGGSLKKINDVYELGASISARVNGHFRLVLTAEDLTDEKRPDQFGFTMDDRDYPGAGRRVYLQAVASLL